MPVYLDSDRCSDDSEEGYTWPLRKPPSQLPELSRCVTIGLINNMPHAAFTATERQFVSLLDAASDGISINLSLYALPGIPRTETSGHRAGSRYLSVDMLWDLRLDALIVTGKEPMTPNLKDESCWESFTKVIDWARDNTHSTVWSCLAAHAAILHMDGIERRRSADKCFGVFECTRVSSHPLMAGAPARFNVPHSRWNGAAEEELAASGYNVLARTADAGVDTFVKQESSLFVFFQGHPEYESGTLLREYRRDVERYLRGEASTYPSAPRSYFSRSAEDALSALREKAMSCRSEDLLSSVAAVLESEKIENTWRRTAVRLYRNWLEYICARRNECQCDGHENVA